jgi:hypothetical protein
MMLNRPRGRGKSLAARPIRMIASAPPQASYSHGHPRCRQQESPCQEGDRQTAAPAAAKSKSMTPAPKAKAAAAPVVTLKAVFE